MSLQIWMPLVKDYENYGLSELKFTNFRYIRFVINEKRGSQDAYTQLSRLEFLDEKGSLFKYPVGTTVSSSMTGYPANEPPACIIDGNVNTKFCAPWSDGGYLTIALGSSETIDISRFSRFQWYTANDSDWRDPISFEVQFSNDGTNFVKGAVVTNASITSTRYALAYTGNCFYANVGKIGSSCYYNNSYELGGLYSDKKINLGNKLSMCCWVNFSALMPDSALGGSMGGQHRYPNNTGMGLTIKYISSTTGYLSCNTGDGNGNRTYNTYCGNTLLSAGTWYHVAFTYDGSAIKFYVNSNLDGTHSYTAQKNVEDYVFLGAWSFESSTDSPTIYGNYKLNGCMNDFRIYDHVLSKKEIKEISKGLVAHYQLKGMGSTNYLKGAGKFTEQNPIVRTASTSASGVMQDAYTYHADSDLMIKIPSAGKYTFVMECDANPSEHKTTGSYGSERRVLIYLQNTSSGNYVHWAEGGSYGRTADGKLYGVFNSLSTGNYRVRTNLYAADNVDYTVKIWNMKVVQGNYNPNDTWCPHSEDELYNNLGLDSVVGIDYSGYGNHASAIDSVTAVANAPRYSSSSCFNSGAYLRPPARSFAGMANSYTFSYWAKIGDMNGKMAWGFMDGNRLNVYPSSWFNWNTGDSADNPFMSGGTNVAFTPYNGGWHHYAITGNGSTTTLYIDGKTVGTAKVYKPLTGTQLIISGWDTSGSYKWDGGSIVDYRIYATCLSSSDVTELYNTGASVSKDGTLFAYDFHENKRNTVDKTGIIATGGFNDRASPTYDMKLKTLEDGSAWARIHYLDVTNDKTFFADASEVAKCTNKNNRYSRMGDVDKFNAGGEYEFMLTYPSIKKTLPAGYTELEYIEATGTQWINTGVTGHARWEFDIQFTNTTKRQLMGYFGNGDEYWGCQTDGKYGLFAGSTIGKAGNRDTIVHDYQRNTATIWVQNQIMSVGGGTEIGSNQYQLFDIMSDPQFCCHAKLWRCKCIQSGALIRDFVPARRNSDGYIGLFDIVNNVFYGNSGTGVFITGGAPSSQYIELYNRWIQTSSPNVTSVSGFKAISTSWPAHNYGLRTHGTTCIYNCDSGETWWYAPIGQTDHGNWNGAGSLIPAANGSNQSMTELWVRIDKSAGAEQTKIYNGAIAAANYVEM
jgi:hypothetical protein